MSTLVFRGNSYQAIAPNHDDLMMNLVLFGWFTSTDVFENLTNIDVKNLLYKERLAEIQDDMVPFGVIDNGQNQINSGEKGDDGNIWLEQEWKGFK